MTQKSTEQHARDLNRLAPAARDAALGQVIADLITTVNALVTDNAAWRAKYATLLAKLDLDAGVTDTNYAATQAAGTATAQSVLPLSAR